MASSDSKIDRVPSTKPKVTVYIADPQVKKDLERLAASRRRSASNLLYDLACAEIAKAKESGELPEIDSE